MRPGSDEPRYVYCRGVRIDTSFAVRTWDLHGLRFTGRSRMMTRAIVLHWTAAENPPAALYHNLASHKSRKTGKSEPLSVHFAVDDVGRVFQFADTELRGAHCAAPEGNSANGWSIGVEFQCRGDATGVASRGVQRKRTTGTIHGKLTTYFEMTAAQLEVGVMLAETLCGLYGLPLVVPEREDRTLITTELPLEALTRYRGVLGHMHLEQKKRDPGLGLLRALQDRAHALEKKE